jgi:hypothetical protein
LEITGEVKAMGSTRDSFVFLVHGFWFMVSGSWFLVLGLWDCHRVVMAAIRLRRMPS